MLVAICAVVMGLLVKPYYEHRNAIMLIERHGEMIDGKSELPSGDNASWLSRFYWICVSSFVDKEQLESPMGVIIHDYDTPLTALRSIAKVRSLSSLTMDHTGADDSVVQALGSNPNMAVLSLNNTKITDRSVKYFGKHRDYFAVSVLKTNTSKDKLDDIIREKPDGTIVWSALVSDADREAIRELAAKKDYAVELEGDLVVCESSSARAGQFDFADLKAIESPVSIYIDTPGDEFEGKLDSDLLQKIKCVNEISIRSGWFTSLDWVADFPNLKSLTLTSVVYQGNFPVLPNLERLYCIETKLSESDFLVYPDSAKLGSIYCLSSSWTDDSMKLIGKLRDLKELSLFGARISNDGLAHLAGQTSLRVLQMDSGEITSIESIQNNDQLKRIELTSTGIGDESLQTISGFKQLEYLGVSHTNVSRDPLFDCLRKLEQIETFSYGGFILGTAAIPDYPYRKGRK